MYWMRYPIRYELFILESDPSTVFLLRLTEEIVKSTFNLLSSNLDSKINPFLLLALVDPKLTWFKKWMASSILIDMYIYHFVVFSIRSTVDAKSRSFWNKIDLW